LDTLSCSTNPNVTNIPALQLSDWAHAPITILSAHETMNKQSFHACKIQAGLVICQGYLPEKHHANQTQNSHLKQYISWGLKEWQPRMTISLVNIQTCRVYIYTYLYLRTLYHMHFYTVYILSVQYIYLFIYNAIKM